MIVARSFFVGGQKQYLFLVSEIIENDKTDWQVNAWDAVNYFWSPDNPENNQYYWFESDNKAQKLRFPQTTPTQWLNAC